VLVCEVELLVVVVVVVVVLLLGGGAVAVVGTVVVAVVGTVVVVRLLSTVVVCDELVTRAAVVVMFLGIVTLEVELIAVVLPDWLGEWVPESTLDPVETGGGWATLPHEPTASATSTPVVAASDAGAPRIKTLERELKRLPTTFPPVRQSVQPYARYSRPRSYDDA
jgi:hypothetical protein